MANLQETLKVYNEKKSLIDEKLAAKRQEIESIMADIEALPSELEGQSTEYINRQKQKLMKKVEKKTKKTQDWIEEQTKKVEDWLKAQQDKIQQNIDKVMELEGQVVQSVATLQAQATLAVLTGQKIEEKEQEDPKVEPSKSLPSAPKRMGDEEYRYSYKNSLGQIVNCLGVEAVKRKRYDPTKIYTDSDEMLKKSNIFRKKYVWSYTWQHGIEEEKEIDGKTEVVVKEHKITSSPSDKPLQTIDEVFSNIDPRFIALKGDVVSVFNQSINYTQYSKTIIDNTSQKIKDIWILYITRN